MNQPNDNQIITSREPYFAAVDLFKSRINCGDDRISNILEAYVHVFGGALFMAYTLAVLQETRQPGSATNLKELTARVIEQLKSAGIAGLGVHSDTACEGGPAFDATKVGEAVGCGYASKRAGISRLIVEQADTLLATASRLMPDLFAGESDLAHGRAVIAAHGRLADRAEQVIGSGRSVVASAAGAGASVAIFEGSHTASEGVINTKADSTLLTGQALAAGLPAYNHDLWASNQLLGLLPNAPDQHQAAIASVIDIMGTMSALGVDYGKIALR